MVHNVVLDDAMEHVAADETKVTIDGGRSALDESPVLGFVMWGLLVGVVEIGDGNYNNQFSGHVFCQIVHIPIQWFIQR